MNSSPVTIESVLQLLRQLPPREQLRVVDQVLPELDRDLPAVLPVLEFWYGADVRTLAGRQGVQPVDDFDALLGGWPKDEPLDDFIAAIRDWRRQNLSEVNAE